MSYLSGRQQLTIVNDKRSEQLPEGPYGVPQGVSAGSCIIPTVHKRHCLCCQL